MVMKRKFIYFLPLLLVVIYMVSCSKETVQKTIPLVVPTGTFDGSFKLVHTTVSTGKNDTVGANLTMVTDAQGNFTITGDTSAVHAGSFGKFSLGVGSDLVFTDNTFPKAGIPTKSHLNGDYRYLYDGNTLGLDKNVGDSLSYQYFFVRSSN
jgi:hypothetical protein